MESGTLELLRNLQSGPYDESGWKNIRTQLRGQRRYLRAQQDLSTLSDLVQLLETWSQQCDDPRLAAGALREAADIAERELHREPIAADLRKRALAVSHGTGGTRPERPIARERAAAIRHDAAGRTPPERPGAREQTGNPHAVLGERRADVDDLDGAIDAYERALNVEADMEVVYKLAELYAKRGAPGDAQQAADLFCTLGDVLGNPAGLPMLQRALEQVPDHVEALSLFQQYGGGAALAPVAPNSVRPRRITRPQTSRSIEPPSASAAKPPRIATHRTVAGLGPPTASTNAAGPILQQKTSSARTLLKPGGGVGSRGRRTGTPGSGTLVAPQPHGPIASGGLPAEPQPKAAEPTPEPSTRQEPPSAAGWNDDATAAAAIEDPVLATSPATGKGPPPLKSAKERARELQPIAQVTPVIRIMQPQQSQPSARPVAPVTSLSPVVVDDERALERSRDRLEKSRTRKRKVLAVTLASTAAAAAIVILVAPRSMQDAQRMAANLFGSDDSSTTTTTSTASQPPSPTPPATEPSQPTAAEPTSPSEPTTAEAAPTTQAVPAEPPQPTAAESNQPATPDPAAAPAAATNPQATETKPEEPAPPSGPSVLAQRELVTLRGGRLTEAQLTKALEKVGPKLAVCYADALEKKPRLKGRLVLAWTVRPNGKVVGAKKQGGTIKDASLTRCSIAAIASTRFPRPKKQAVQVKLPFEYKR